MQCHVHSFPNLSPYTPNPPPSVWMRSHPMAWQGLCRPMCRLRHPLLSQQVPGVSTWRREHSHMSGRVAHVSIRRSTEIQPRPRKPELQSPLIPWAVLSSCKTIWVGLHAKCVSEMSTSRVHPSSRLPATAPMDVLSLQHHVAVTLEIIGVNLAPGHHRARKTRRWCPRLRLVLTMRGPQNFGRPHSMASPRCIRALTWQHARWGSCLSSHQPTSNRRPAV